MFCIIIIHDEVHLAVCTSSAPTSHGGVRSSAVRTGGRPTTTRLWGRLALALGACRRGACCTAVRAYTAFRLAA
jgi:hypothetical protein